MTQEANQMFIRREAEAFRIITGGDLPAVIELVTKHAKALREYAEEAYRDGVFLDISDLVVFLRARIRDQAAAPAA